MLESSIRVILQGIICLLGGGSMGSIGEVIKQLRKQRGYTQGQVEAFSKGKIKRSYLSNLEAGNITMPSQDKLRALAEVLNTTEPSGPEGDDHREDAPPSKPPTSSPPSSEALPSRAHRRPHRKADVQANPCPHRRLSRPLSGGRSNAPAPRCRS